MTISHLLSRMGATARQAPVSVTLAGEASAVISLARALTHTAAVTAMSRHVCTDDSGIIRLDATCHPRQTPGRDGYR